MRVGVDATCWANERGYGRFTRETCAAMVAAAPGTRFTFFADARAAARFELSGDNVELVVVHQRVSPTEAAAADGGRSPLDMLRLTRAVRAAPLDVFFSPSVYTFFPLPPGLPAVVTVHDAIAERFPELTLPTLRARLRWKAKVRLALLQARLVLTVSEFSKRDITRVLRVPAERIRVTVEAPAPEYAPAQPAEVDGARARAGLPAGARWITYVGGFNPHKNVDLVVEALAALRDEYGNDATPYLLLVGTLTEDVFHGDQGRIRARVAELSLEHHVLWTGFVPDRELRYLHAGALALVLPSACEGFGLPAVEAAACGTPVVATTESPLPEVLAEGGWFVPPGDVTALTAALRQVVSDEPERLRRGGVARQRAQALSWQRGAAIVLDALAEAAR